MQVRDRRVRGRGRAVLHRFEAGGACRIGAGRGPAGACPDIDDILRVARATGADAVHPGHGFLSEPPEFAAASEAAGIVFVSPAPVTRRRLGDKASARAVAERADRARHRPAAADLPAMLKASRGGGACGRSKADVPGRRGAHQACSSESARTSAGCETLRSSGLASTDRYPGATPFAFASFMAMTDATVRKARSRKAPSGLCADAATQEAEPRCSAARSGARDSRVAEGLEVVDDLRPVRPHGQPAAVRPGQVHRHLPARQAARFSCHPEAACPGLACLASRRMMPMPCMPSSPLTIGFHLSSNIVIPACAEMCCHA